ncbi:MAG: DNA mismatch repair protein MutS [Thermoplasmata archaeon]|nr:DNA mismatch repair protein MutS [Thermoplasmata archaeon]MCI4359877.1 DNA mismatch repair protein MutS [Thermoplasmata archaeon]
MTDSPATTPLMEQYEGVKAQYPGHLVLFRVGDFFETFGDDARLVAKELDVVLTARSADARGVRIPMAGVPHHAVETYLGRLVEKGYKVALCDQVEDARLAKGLVRREVTRVVTPGTVVEERILPGPESNFLASLVLRAAGPALFAAVDVTTGEWYRGRARSEGIEGAVAALAPFTPRETLLATEGSAPSAEALARALRREFPRIRVETAPPASERSALPAGLQGPGPDPDWEADLRLAQYVRSTQPRLLPYLEIADAASSVERLVLDAKTLRHLEIFRPMNPEDPTGATLIRTWDATVTPSGRRTLTLWLKNPLAAVVPIQARQDAVEWLVGRGAELIAWRRDLGTVADVARISARLASRRLRPTELFSLRDSLAGVATVAVHLAKAGGLPKMLGDLRSRLDPLPKLSELLGAALPASLPADGSDPGRFRIGFSAELDALRGQEQLALSELEQLERREQTSSGIRSLKVGFNQVFGFYFEISRPNLSKAPGHLRRKQTLSGGERFTSDELEGIEARILNAREALRRVESEAWEAFLGRVEQFVPALYRLSRAVGELDTLLSFAWIAQERGHTRPIVDESRELAVRNGRHPVLDRSLSGQFVPNDTELDAESARLLVLTGPNMSGKSTYMRQVGLLVVLAQAGAFVPAKFCRVGLVSSLFTRMGFTDEIGRGKSSFMVEMSEVAEILEGADDRSLVLLDEVGRGTSTFDGLALAWATLQYLHDSIRCRTVLATHYHQLTELIERLPAARNAHLAVRDTDGEVVFLHRLVPGSTDRSYGIHVARLAGLPGPLLDEAARLLKRLEEEGPALAAPGRARRGGPRYTQAILLADPAVPSESGLDSEIRGLDLDRMTPVDALRWVAEARRKLGVLPPPDPAA